jgi:hypothetical protein
VYGCECECECDGAGAGMGVCVCDLEYGGVCGVCGTLSMEVVRSLGWDSGLGMEVCVWCMCVYGGVCGVVP